MTQTRVDAVVPYEASERGSIMWGELRNDRAKFPGILVQFSRIDPKSRKGRIYLYPTPEQARRLFAVPPPFTFEGSFFREENVQEHWKATGIWLNSGSQITYKEAFFWTSPWGSIEDLEVTITTKGPERQSEPFGWYVANRCFLLQVLANRDENQKADAKKFGLPERSFSLRLSDSSTAEIRRYVTSHRPGVTKETKKMGYSISVKDLQNAVTTKRDIEALLILASFASRERSMLRHWSTEDIDGLMRRYWTFNIPKCRRRPRGIEPLVPRDPDQCGKFLTSALKVYIEANHTEMLDAAIYALLLDELALEVKIVRLVSGIQSALIFALQEPRTPRSPQIKALYDKFLEKYTPDFNDLWPLVGASKGESLSRIRNAAVHGGVFAERDWTALSYAAENLHWLLERIILISLGWDIQNSAVSPAGLRFYHAYQWQSEQRSLKI
jgi:hypothetical protein